MKKLLPLFVLSVAAFFASGCNGMGTISKNLSKDPAIVVVRLGTPWGTESFTRVGGQNDNVTVSPDGSISITQTRTNAYRGAQVATLNSDGSMTLPASLAQSLLARQREQAPAAKTNAITEAK